MTIIMHHTKEQQEEIIQGLSTLCKMQERKFDSQTLE